VIAFCELLCLARRVPDALVTVNKHNDEFDRLLFRARGFSNETSIVTDIGKGFVMGRLQDGQRLTPTEERLTRSASGVPCSDRRLRAPRHSPRRARMSACE
jgi:hypothetical protein